MSKKKKVADAEYGPREDVLKIVPNLPEHPSQMRRWIENGFPAAITMGYRTRLWHIPSVRQFMEGLRAEAAKKAAAIKRKAGR